ATGKRPVFTFRNWTCPVPLLGETKGELGIEGETAKVALGGYRRENRRGEARCLAEGSQRSSGPKFLHNSTARLELRRTVSGEGLGGSYPATLRTFLGGRGTDPRQSARWRAFGSRPSHDSRPFHYSSRSTFVFSR